MPKQKTNKTAKKRFAKITKKGKILVRNQSNQHLARRKSKRSKQNSKRKNRINNNAKKKLQELGIKI